MKQVMHNCVIEWSYSLGEKCSYLQKQRITVDRALAMNPQFIVCDEPVSAIAVSVRSQILNLLLDLQTQFNLSFLFISHDLSTISHLSHRVGKMVEMATTHQLLKARMHPYTEAFLSAIPLTHPRVKRERIVLPGESTNPANPPSGCYFHSRCRYAQDICTTKKPSWEEEIAPAHHVACHLATHFDLQGVEL